MCKGEEKKKKASRRRKCKEKETYFINFGRGKIYSLVDQDSPNIICIVCKLNTKIVAAAAAVAAAIITIKCIFKHSGRKESNPRNNFPLLLLTVL